jgi:hypothetical protein
VFWALRSPYRWTRDYVYNLVVRPDVLNLSEQSVLSAALTGWLDALQAEALRKAGGHPLWKAIAVRFESDLARRPATGSRRLPRVRVEGVGDLEQAGQALVAGLEQNPALLYTLRGGKFALDVAVIAGVVYFTWPPGWLLLLIPVGVSLTHQFSELATRAWPRAPRTGSARTARR